MVGHTGNLATFLEHVVHVALLRRARVELALDAVEAGLQERGLCQVRIAGGVDCTELEAAAAGNTDERRAVLPAVVLVDRRAEAEVPETLVRVDRRGGDPAEAAVVVEDAPH